MNIAYIDGQNLRMGTYVNSDKPWEIDLKRFREYLRKKFNIEEAYYFVGVYMQSKHQLYELIQRSGYIVVFREHGQNLKSFKKGNIDVDLTFYVMRDLIEREQKLVKVFIVSGDGDYFKMVEYLVSKGKFGRMLMPNRRYASSLYRKLGAAHQLWLDDPDIVKKIERK